MSKTIIEIKKNQNESNVNVLRRFSKRVRETNMLKSVKEGRYCKRAQSKLTAKNWALKRIAKMKEFAKLKKLGKA